MQEQEIVIYLKRCFEEILHYKLTPQVLCRCAIEEIENYLAFNERNSAESKKTPISTIAGE